MFLLLYTLKKIQICFYICFTDASSCGKPAYRPIVKVNVRFICFIITVCMLLYFCSIFTVLQTFQTSIEAILFEQYPCLFLNIVCLMLLYICNCYNEYFCLHNIRFFIQFDFIEL